VTCESRQCYYLTTEFLISEEDVSQKSEDNLAMAESELDKHTNLITDLTRKIDDLQVKADEAERLKDQVDE